MTETARSDMPLADVMLHVDLALDGITATLRALGDDLVNVRPELPGANSAYVLAVHCAGVMEHWGGVISGREIVRDREAEFVATGTVADAVATLQRQRAVLRADLEGFDGAAPPRQVTADIDEREIVRSQGAVLLHVYEELAQHRGHLDLTADLARRPDGQGLAAS